MLLDYSKIQFTVFEDTMDHNSPIQAQWMCGTKAVKLCKSKQQMDKIADELGWLKTKSTCVAVHFNIDSFVPFEVLNTLEMTKWRYAKEENPTPKYLIKIYEKKGMLIYSQDPELMHTLTRVVNEAEKDWDDMLHTNGHIINAKAWLIQNRLSGSFGAKYFGL